MDLHLQEWLHLIVRWLHVVAGISWMGESFYFMWLDAQVHRAGSAKPGVAGETWMVHGGGFYQVEKYLVAPAHLPATLHWFKWESYTTWLSGFALLVLVYYFGARAFLIDPQVANLTPAVAIGIGLSSLLVAWFVYDGLCCSPLGRTGWPLLVVGVLLLAGAAYGYTQVFSSRAAYIHVGALLGTLMAGNVWRRIIPAQRRVVRQLLAGEPPDAALGRRAKQRSVQNSYFSLPVVFIMVSSHFPSTYGHAYNWAVLVGLIVVGALVRHFFIVRNAGRRAVWIWPAVTAGVMALALVTRPTPSVPMASAAGATPITFSEVQAVIDARCRSCHSATPTSELFPSPPNGVMFDTAAQIRAQAERIKVRAVDQQTMPLANTTGITDAERQLLGRWVAAGALGE